jgi:mannitol-1-phosphate/altronate dehydrogenase
MNGLQPSHEIRKLTIVLPAHVVDALRSQLRGNETVTDCIKRLVVREALGVANKAALPTAGDAEPAP